MPDSRERSHSFCNQDLESMSTAELEELLRLDAHSMSHNNSDTDWIFRVLEVLEKRERACPSQNSPDVDAAWESFQNHYLPTGGDGLSLYEDDPENDTLVLQTQKTTRKKRSNRFPIGRIVVVAAVLALSCGTIAAQAGGLNLLKSIANWTSETFHFELPGSSASDQPALAEHADSEYQSLADAVAAYGITEPVVPAWWPEGFELTQLTVSSDETQTNIVALYENGSLSFVISISQYASFDAIPSTIYEKDDTTVIQYRQDDITHYIMSNIDDFTAAWTNGLLECCISGDLTVSELENMIDSMYEG